MQWFDLIRKSLRMMLATPLQEMKNDLENDYIKPEATNYMCAV